MNPEDIPPGAIISTENADNFVRNLATVAVHGGDEAVPALDTRGRGYRKVTPRSARNAAPLVPLDEIKMHLRIAADQTAEDGYLTGLEAAARVHTENYLRYPVDAATLNPNVRHAMLLLIAHFYRHRESVSDATFAEVPMAYTALLHPERDFDDYFGSGYYVWPPLVIEGPPGPPGDQGIPGPPGKDATQLAWGHIEVPDADLPVWPQTLVLMDTTVDLPAAELAAQVNVVLSIQSTAQEDVITLACNGHNVAQNLGKTAGPDGVLSSMYAFALKPPNTGGPYQIKVEAGAGRAGIHMYGTGGPFPQWMSYITWSAGVSA